MCSSYVWTSTDCSLLDELGFVAVLEKQTWAALVEIKVIPVVFFIFQFTGTKYIQLVNEMDVNSN